ncbi:hypothetical protein GQ600_23003 [Phytophthora cactorum]|nr:hypothetical protein GQ600_23003 [Phytophthora cactorum]
MKIAFFSTHSYDIESIERVAKEDGITPKHELKFFTRVWTPHPPSWPRVAKVSASSSTMSLMKRLCASWLPAEQGHLPALRWVRHDRPEGRQGTGPCGDSCACLLAVRCGRARCGSYADSEPQDPSLVQPHSRAELPLGRPAGI